MVSVLTPKLDASSSGSAQDSILRYDLLTEAEVAGHPFEYCIVPHLISDVHLEAIQRDFPIINQAGSFPLSAVRCGPTFKRLTEELASDRLRSLLARKFNLDLAGRAATLTVCGRTLMSDGQIRTDGQTALLTLFLFLNRNWEAAGGRLRLLRSAHDLDQVIAEVPPEAGTLVAIRCRPNAWYGHLPFDGPRRSLQLSYGKTEEARRWSNIRQSLSAIFNSLRG